jgi:NIF3 (NGG1p interacting factor 3)
VAGFLSKKAHATAAVTAREAIERILDQLGKEGVVRRQPTTDTIKIGDPGTPVTGIATTFQATLDLLKRAAAAKTNLILSHESLFCIRQTKRIFPSGARIGCSGVDEQQQRSGRRRSREEAERLAVDVKRADSANGNSPNSTECR